MFSQFGTERKLQVSRNKIDGKQTELLFFEMVEAEKTVDATLLGDSALTVLLCIFWTAEVLWFPGIILLGFNQNMFLLSLVLIFISTVLHITNSVFLCMCRVPGRGKLSACDCRRPFCMSKPYAVASAALIIPNLGVAVAMFIMMVNAR
jgi:hypothetical protein